MRASLISFCMLLATLTALGQSTGVLTGTVKDRQTQAPLAGITVALEGTVLGTVSDEDGNFRIQDIPAKTYNLRLQSLDYKGQTIYNVVITSGNVQVLSVEMEQNTVGLNEVVIRKDPFQKSAESPLSLQTLSAQEIKSNPGGNFDVSRVIQAFPGVSGTSGSVGGYRNDLIIRGGAPNENVYYLDGIELPVINHFATQGSAGGPTGIINISFIEDISLHTGAFPAKYDNPLSGVLHLKQRRANPEKIQHNLRLSATELAYTVDGPITNKLSFLASARRSYLQLLFRALQLPIQPSYWDFQYKIDYKINKNLSIYTLAVGAIDDFSFLLPDEQTPENTYILRSNPLIRQWNYTNGYGLKGLMKNGYWNLTASRSMLNNELDKFEDNQNPVEEQRTLRIRSQEAETKTRFEWNKYFSRWSYSWGIMAQHDQFKNDVFSRIRNEIRNSNGQILEPAVTINSNTALSFWRYGAFAQIAGNFLQNRATVSFGLRADGNSFTQNGNNLGETLSPRLAFSLQLIENLKLNASAGQYYKIPPYTILGYKDAAGTYVNKNSSYIQSNHLSAGFEYIPQTGRRITLEGFYKQYKDYPISLLDGISLANKGGDFNVLGNEPVITNGTGRSYGLEFQAQQKLTNNLFALLSYTYYISEFTNFNTGYIPASWDNRHLLSFIGGYKFKRNYELGIKFRYQGGAPYTPFDLTASQRNYLTTGVGQINASQFNTLRLGSFNAMDVRINKKWNFQRWSLDVYLDVSNVYAANQPAYPKFTFQRTPDNSDFLTTDGQPIKSDGSNAVPLILNDGSGTVIPSIGFIAEF